ncbi:hypothetical protein F3I50_12015 [Pantoea sp. M_5]|nr:hypothetical protein F3I50_12015 [Pantoea sp. M_5]
MPSRKELANAIRALSMDAVQKAKSGHPGAPMGKRFGYSVPLWTLLAELAGKAIRSGYI